MKAVGMLKGKDGIHLFDVPKPIIMKEDEVLIKVTQAGVDGTDFNIVHYNLQDVPPGRDKIILGHEMIGVVEEAGRNVLSLKKGDCVVVTVRRGCGICSPCLHDESDMCLTGLYTECGIHKKDGFFAEYVLEKEKNTLKVDESLKDIAVLTEPLSIAEKAVEQIKHIREHSNWACGYPEHSFKGNAWGKCKTGLIIGAGPLGVMAAALLRLAGVETYITDVLPPDSLRAKLALKTGTRYIDVSRGGVSKILEGDINLSGKIDIVIEAAGTSGTSFELINHMSRSGVYVMLGIPRDKAQTQIDVSKTMRNIVRSNMAIVGSINSNRRHFSLAINDLEKINKRFDNILAEMITNKFPLSDYKKAFSFDDGGRIKTIFEM